MPGNSVKCWEQWCIRQTRSLTHAGSSTIWDTEDIYKYFQRKTSLLSKGAYREIPAKPISRRNRLQEGGLASKRNRRVKLGFCSFSFCSCIYLTVLKTLLMARAVRSLWGLTHPFVVITPLWSQRVTAGEYLCTSKKWFRGALCNFWPDFQGSAFAF